MSRIAPCLVAFALTVIITPLVGAQSPEMPEPLAIVVDADGKPMVQVASIRAEEVNVLFDFDGVSAGFELILQNGSFNGCCFVFFSDDNCLGDVYMSPWSENRVLEVSNQQGFAIAGPDATSGTYRVFRSTSTSVSPTFPESVWNQTTILGTCLDINPDQINLLTAEEILPNPLDGFNGPTVANPERLLTVKGGTRLP